MSTKNKAWIRAIESAKNAPRYPRKKRSDSVSELSKAVKSLEAKVKRLESLLHESEPKKKPIPERLEIDLSPLADFIHKVRPLMTATGPKGLYVRRNELPYPFNELTRRQLETAAKQMLQDGMVQRMPDKGKLF